MVAGVRFEGTQMNTLGYNVTLYPAGSKNCATRAPVAAFRVPVIDHPTYVNALPSVSLRYALDQNPACGLVYGRGDLPAGHLPAGPLRHRGRFHQSRRQWRRQPEPQTGARQQLRSAL